MSLVAGNLDQYGSWRDDTSYGRVWYPRVSTPGWRPYCYGRWSWLFPFGWTWVSSEPWGWAPYHYGTWICSNWGWGWVPGPSLQPWCPALVSFFERDGRRCWAPLSPWEVRYPTYSPLSRRNSNWTRCYSIGWTAVYYPTTSRYCEPRPWSTHYCNTAPSVTYITYVTVIKPRKKIVYKCPDHKGGSTRIHLDGAPDRAFEEVFHRPLDKPATGTIVSSTPPKPSTSTTVAQAPVGSTTDGKKDWRSVFKGFVPRAAQQGAASSALTLETLHDATTAITSQRFPKSKSTPVLPDTNQALNTTTQATGKEASSPTVNRTTNSAAEIIRNFILNSRPQQSIPGTAASQTTVPSSNATGNSKSGQAKDQITKDEPRTTPIQNATAAKQTPPQQNANAKPRSTISEEVAARLRQIEEARIRAIAEQQQREQERRARQDQERQAREQAQREQKDREQKEREAQAAARGSQERAAQERAAQERAANERAAREREAQERAAKEREAQARRRQESERQRSEQQAPPSTSEPPPPAESRRSRRNRRSD